MRTLMFDRSNLAAAAIAACAAAICAFPVTAGTSDERQFVRHHAAGTETVTERAAAAPLAAAKQKPVAAPRADELLWHNFHEWPIYTTAEITIPHGSLVAGTYLNDPRQTELIPLEGDGTPSWVYPGTQFYVAASRNGEVIASIDYTGATLTLNKWHPDSDVPDWSYVISSASPASYRALNVSPDGSIIALFVTVQGTSNFSRLYTFSPDSSVPLAVFDDAPGTFARSLSITTNGEYVALNSAAMVHVINSSDGSVRYSGSAGASNDAMAISGDGNILAYGWMTLYVRQWNGSTYQSLFSKPGGGRWVRNCLPSADGSAMAVAWNPPGCTQNSLELYELPSSTPAWTYEYEVCTGEYQDVIYNLSMTNDGQYIVAGSWGDQFDTNPEIHVFERSQPEPIFTYSTPGSMFDIDIARAEDGSLYLAACGKHVHANQQGHGGDLFAFNITVDVVGDVNGDGVVDVLDLIELLAAWGDCPDPPDECPADLNDDGVVDVLDLLIILGNWT